jgi:hypothetical protein
MHVGWHKQKKTKFAYETLKAGREGKVDVIGMI